MRNERQCTEENPYTPEKHNKGDFWVHTEAYEVGDQMDGYPGGDIVTMKCPTCGITWQRELPQ